jgi:hypothetical protein
VFVQGKCRGFTVAIKLPNKKLTPEQVDEFKGKKKKGEKKKKKKKKKKKILTPPFFLQPRFIS